MCRNRALVPVALVVLALPALHACGGCVPRGVPKALQITLTDSSGAPITDARVLCSPWDGGLADERTNSQDGVYTCGTAGGRYEFEVYWHGSLVLMQTVDVGGDRCHSPGVSTALSFTLTAPRADAGPSADAGTDGAREQ